MSRRYQPRNPHHDETIAAHARSMRHAPSATEHLLWSQLSGRKLGPSFKRQYVVGTFIADFAAPACRLIVEVDGKYHERRSRADEARDAKLRRLGWRVLRIPADMVSHNLPAAIEAVRAALTWTVY